MEKRGSEENGLKNKNDYHHVWRDTSEIGAVERLYLAKCEGVRGLVSIEYSVNDERENLALYALGSNENLIIAARAELKL